MSEQLGKSAEGGAEEIRNEMDNDYDFITTIMMMTMENMYIYTYTHSLRANDKTR